MLTVAPPLTRTRLREDYVRAFSGKANVDRANHVIREVKVCGVVSRNKRKYPLDVLREAAPLYEECDVFFSPHPPKAADRRDVARAVGKLRNVRMKESGLFADLHLLPSHEFTPQILDAAERMPSLYALSHDADGDLLPADATGYKSVQRIFEVFAVDVVNRGGCNDSLFEDFPVPMTLREFIIGRTKEAGKPPEKLVRLLEDDYSELLDQPMPQATEAAPPAAPAAPDPGVTPLAGADVEQKDPKVCLIDGITAALKANDPQMHSLAEDIMDLIKKKYHGMGMALPGGAGPAGPAPAPDLGKPDADGDGVPDDDDADPDDPEENQAMKEELDKLRAENKRLTESFDLREQIRDELQTRGIEARDPAKRRRLVESLSTLGTLDKVREHLTILQESAPGAGKPGASKPRSSGIPGSLAATPARTIPDDPAEFAKRLLNGRK